MTTPTLSRSLLNRLRYKHLHMLVTLSTSQNLHRASQSLNMSQPAATRMLHEIEDMFGCDLFERLPRGMRPTALGQELIHFAESALSGLDRCAEDLMARQQGGYGYLSIGTIMGAAPDLVMDSIAEIKSLNPQLRIRIMGDTSDQVIQLLEQGRIDLAIARRNAATDSEHYVFEQLGNERLLVVVHAGIRWPGARSWKWRNWSVVGRGFCSRKPARRASVWIKPCSAWHCRCRQTSSNAARCIRCSS
jgi:DNA-binding transcriptional LysR family regulator